MQKYKKGQFTNVKSKLVSFHKVINLNDPPIFQPLIHSIDRLDV